MQRRNKKKAEYICRKAVINITAETGAWETQNRVRELPAADVEPVKRGKWIKQEGFWNKNTVKCSLCGNYLDMNGVNGGRSDANYCPNCGARMDDDEK